MFNQADRDLVARVHGQYPQFEKLLSRILQEELSNLPGASLDKVQKIQGRVLFLNDLLMEYHYAAGITADRTAKPQL
mgnify:CR=1 FL=1